MIRELEYDVINKIAAGEVVQRPSSVVKELIENSIDSDANQIDVSIIDSGKTLIKVSDNGIGMSKRDIRLCYKKHTTSKILNSDDLLRLSTKGFRGEALSSIGSVSKMIISSSDNKKGIRNVLNIENGQNVEETEESGLNGTLISVQNLFYNVPARRKFLKSDNVELRHIVEEFIRLAIGHSNIHFSLKHNEKDLYLLNPSNLKERLIRVFGKSVDSKIVSISEETPIAKINGFIYKPEYLNKSRKYQYLFVNNRFVKSSYLNHAISKSYEGLTAEENQPSYFVFIDVPEETIDVNVHPTKTEVKFEDEKSIYAIIRSSVRHSLGKFNVIPNIDFSNDINLSNLSSTKDVNPPSLTFNESFNPFEKNTISNLKNDVFDHNKNHEFNSNINIFQNHKDISDSVKFFSLSDRFIVTKTSNDLIIIDVSRAKYRILYERFLKEISSDNNFSQKLMFPISLDYDKSEIRILNEVRDQLIHLGFSFSNFDENNIELDGIHPSFNHDSINLLFEELIENNILDYKESSTSLNDYLSKLMAKSKSINKKISLNDFEQEELINELFACRESSFCPDSKKTYHTFDLNDLKKLFQ